LNAKELLYLNQGRKINFQTGVKYCDVFGRMPSLLVNLKLDTPVVAKQPKVKHFHGYAHHSVLLVAMVINSSKTSVSIGTARCCKGKAIHDSELVSRWKRKESVSGIGVSECLESEQYSARSEL
jgi:hypothetical protein